MEASSKRKRISRIDTRDRPAVEVELEEQSVQDRQSLGEEEARLVASLDEPLLVRERQGRKIMGNKHLLFHRRQAESTPPVQTVVVDVIATVDTDGSVVGTETKTPTTDAVATIAAVPIVPAVPPFPSDLKVPPVPSVAPVSMPTVPAFPFPSGVPSIEPGDSEVSPPPTLTATTARSSATVISGGFNSTSTSTRSSTPTLSSARSGSTSVTLSSSELSASSQSTSTSSPSSSVTLTVSDSSSLTSGTWSWDPVVSSTVYVVGGGPANTATAPAATQTSVNASAPESAPPITTPQVVGSVIGSLAGAAVLLALLLFLIRRHKRKRGGALQLPGQDAGDSQPIASSGQEMAQRRSFPSSTAFFSRFSVTSRSTADTSTTGERGFHRVSGRKLPSAFSEGMTSEQFEPREGTLSGSSFYRDDSGFYGGPGLPPGSSGAPASAGAVGAKEKFMPSPARTPVIHHPDDAPPFGGTNTPTTKGQNFSRPQSPPTSAPSTATPRPRGTLGRSHPSFDGSRGSKFTEDV